ncbi:NADP-dependent malic enzyme-like [Spodoptera litura]|uniref:Malic enzyme n=1 Tax=Spodoptera litura TaxID=69820 RepID=A0A9J7ED61_SPOLT|nr:NADP-dependent malic enzyme-like [Spodoptera litura]
MRSVKANFLVKEYINKNPLRVLVRAYSDEEVIPNSIRGFDYIRHPRLNKGLAFTLEERQTLGIHGLLASTVRTQEEQIAICKYSLERYGSPLNKHLYLAELLDTNEKLFYELMSTDVEKYLPLVYTPTVGLVCQRFGLVYKRPRGLFITIHDKGKIHQILRNWPESHVRAICFTDGERILGLGDLGAFGMGIPIGKLCLYTALAGVPPAHCLPITLDVGTNNQSLLEDPMYIGVRQKRVTGSAYDELIEEFMVACVKRYSQNVLLQFEDFALANATRLLDRYKNAYCTFNDDIQGTASVVVAGMYAACRITKKKLKENIYLFLGAGSAGVGIASLLCDAMVEEGISMEEAIKKVYMVDHEGLLSTKRQSGIPPHAVKFGKDMEPTKDFASLVTSLKPTCLVGASTVGGAFTPAILQQMAKNTERPQIFALSNPTVKAECTPQQAYDNTEGRCIYASGSPFPPTKYGGKTYYTGQGNNSYVFPGIALGVIICHARHVPDSMFLSAAKTLALCVTEKDLNLGRIYPHLNEVRNISNKIAASIINRAYDEKLAGMYPKPKDVDCLVQQYLYNTKYINYMPDCYNYPGSDSGIKVKTIEEMIAKSTKKTGSNKGCKK